MRREPTFFDPGLAIKNCVVGEGAERQHPVQVHTGNAREDALLARQQTLLGLGLKSPVRVRIFKKISGIQKQRYGLIGAGTVLDLSGSSVRADANLGSLHDDYLTVGKDFRAIGDDLRRVLIREKRKPA